MKPGDLRRWNAKARALLPEGALGDVFVLLHDEGMFHAQGSRAGDPPVTHWTILLHGGPSRGWTEPHLLRFSEPADGSCANLPDGMV